MRCSLEFRTSSFLAELQLHDQEAIVRLFIPYSEKNNAILCNITKRNESYFQHSLVSIFDNPVKHFKGIKLN